MDAGVVATGEGVPGVSPMAPEPTAAVGAAAPMDESAQTDAVKRRLEAASLGAPTHAGLLARVAEQ
eukprot:1126446-Lingulodinium_polyedra.AAC.1